MLHGSAAVRAQSKIKINCFQGTSSSVDFQPADSNRKTATNTGDLCTTSGAPNCTLSIRACRSMMRSSHKPRSLMESRLVFTAFHHISARAPPRNRPRDSPNMHKKDHDLISYTTSGQACRRGSFSVLEAEFKDCIAFGCRDYGGICGLTMRVQCMGTMRI